MHGQRRTRFRRFGHGGRKHRAQPSRCERRPQRARADDSPALHHPGTCCGRCTKAPRCVTLRARKPVRARHCCHAIRARTQ
jgi:hypothetical protein